LIGPLCRTARRLQPGHGRKAETTRAGVEPP
jgi:hypothetical protein